MNSENQKKTNPWIWVGLVGAILVFFLMKKRLLPSDATLDQSDLDYVTSNTPAGASAILANDTSPAFYEVGNGLTEEARLAFGEAITSKWAARMQTIADNLQANPVVVGAGIGAILSIENAIVSERAMSLYLQMMEQWSGRVSSAVAAVSDTISDIAIATIAGVSSATICTSTTLIKDSVLNSVYDVNTVKTAGVTNSGNSLLWGLFGSKKAVKTVATQVREITTTTQSLTFIPVCTGWGLDLAKVDSLFATQNISLLIAYATLKTVLDSAPKAEYFVARSV